MSIKHKSANMLRVGDGEGKEIGRGRKSGGKGVEEVSSYPYLLYLIHFL